MLPVWLRLSFAELVALLNIFYPTPSLSPEFRWHWWCWRRRKRLNAIWSRYQLLPDLRHYLFARLQLRL